MKYLSILLFFLQSGIVFPARAQQRTDFGTKTAQYLPPGSDSLQYNTIFYRYKISLQDNHFLVHFRTDVHTFTHTCRNQKAAGRRNCDYERGRFLLGLVCARQLNVVLSARVYSENYKEEIKQAADSVFISFNKLFASYKSATNEGYSLPEQQKWESYLFLLLQKTTTAHPLRLHWEGTANGIFKNPELYKDAKNYLYCSGRQTAFEDRFLDNHNDWLRPEDTTQAVIRRDSVRPLLKNGALQIANFSSNERNGFDIAPEINYNRDFEITLTAEILSSKRKSTVAAEFFWGLDTSNQKGSTWIAIDRLGEVYVTFCHGGDHSHCERNHFYAYTKKGTVNIVIRKVSDRYYFFVNGRFEKSYPFQPLPGKALALAAERRTTVSFDYLKIDYLD